MYDLPRMGLAFICIYAENPCNAIGAVDCSDHSEPI